MSGQQQQKKPATTTPATETTTESPVVDPYRSNFQSVYGDRVGGFIWDQVDKNASPDKIDGYISDFALGQGDSLGEFFSEHASPGQEELGLQAGPAVAGELDRILGDANIGENLYHFLGERPVTTGILGAAGLAAYIASDPDIKGSKDFKLGDNTSLMLGGDGGSLFDLGLEEVEGALTHKRDNQTFRLYGSHGFDQNRSTVGVGYHTHDGMGTSLTAGGEFTRQGDRNSANAHLRYLTPEWGAALESTWDSAHPTFGDYGTLKGGINSRGDGPASWNLGAQFDTEGAYRFNGGYQWSDDNGTSFGLEGHHGRDATGREDTGLQAVFRKTF